MCTSALASILFSELSNRMSSDTSSRQSCASYCSTTTSTETFHAEATKTTSSSDYSPAKDLVFANLNLTGSDCDVFSALYEHTSGSLALPDVTVYLDLEFDHTLERIRARDRPYEREIDPDYIRRLANGYARHLGHLSQRVERVPIERSWTAEKVAAVVAAAAGLDSAT
jgi:hypothetical protein